MNQPSSIEETPMQRAQRILNQLKSKYPDAYAFDLDGRALHFVCEVEPTADHPEYDKAVEVMIQTLPHKHHKMTQYYRILSGTLRLHVDDKTIELHEGDTYTIHPEEVHWATSEDECWVELRSEPGWTKEDHVLVE